MLTDEVRMIRDWPPSKTVNTYENLKLLKKVTMASIPMLYKAARQILTFYNNKKRTLNTDSVHSTDFEGDVTITNTIYGFAIYKQQETLDDSEPTIIIKVQAKNYYYLVEVHCGEASIFARGPTAESLSIPRQIVNLQVDGNMLAMIEGQIPTKKLVAELERLGTLTAIPALPILPAIPFVLEQLNTFCNDDDTTSWHLKDVQRQVAEYTQHLAKALQHEIEAGLDFKASFEEANAEYDLDFVETKGSRGGNPKPTRVRVLGRVRRLVYKNNRTYVRYQNTLITLAKAIKLDA